MKPFLLNIAQLVALMASSVQAGQVSPAGSSIYVFEEQVSKSQDYELGPDDQIKIWVLGFEEISSKIIRVDPSGYIDLPVLGRFTAGGLTVNQLKSKLLERLETEVQH